MNAKWRNRLARKQQIERIQSAGRYEDYIEPIEITEAQDAESIWGNVWEFPGKPA